MNKTMKGLVVASVLLLGLKTATAATIGQPAPAFELQSAMGETISLADFRGKTVILEWTNHDCPFVQKHYDSGNMQSLQQQYAAQDVVWLSIISSAPGKQGHVDSATAQQLTRSRQAAPAHVLFDPEGVVGRAYGAKTTPHMYIIEGDDQRLRYQGAIDSIRSANPADIAKADNYVKTAMAALAQGRQPDPASTRPYGCSVKY